VVRVAEGVIAAIRDKNDKNDHAQADPSS